MTVLASLSLVTWHNFNYSPVKGYPVKTFQITYLFSGMNVKQIPPAYFIQKLCIQLNLSDFMLTVNRLVN